MPRSASPARPIRASSRARQPRATLLEKAAALTAGAILLGTASFWEGVDVLGDALSLVIIDKLAVRETAPRSALVAARMQACAEAGGDPFATLQPRRPRSRSSRASAA